VVRGGLLRGEYPFSEERLAVEKGGGKALPESRTGAYRDVYVGYFQNSPFLKFRTSWDRWAGKGWLAAIIWSFWESDLTKKKSLERTSFERQARICPGGKKGLLQSRRSLELVVWEADAAAYDHGRESEEPAACNLLREKKRYSPAR